MLVDKTEFEAWMERIMGELYRISRKLDKAENRQMLPSPLRTIRSAMPFRCRSMSFSYLPILNCCYLSCSDGEVGSIPFSFRLSVCPMFPCDVFRPRIGRFRFRGKKQRLGE